jgi:hypothetical protein
MIIAASEKFWMVFFMICPFLSIYKGQMNKPRRAQLLDH